MQAPHDPGAAIAERVAAWHNRHPLAQRIGAAQVHGIGVVSLPYAVRGAQVAPLPVADAQPAQPGTGADLERATDPEAGGPAGEPAADAPAAGTQAAKPPAQRMADGGFDGLDPQLAATLAAEAAAEAAAVAEDAAAAATPRAPSQPPEAEASSTTPAAWRLQRQVSLPPRSARKGWRGWWQRRRERRAYRALFTEDFIAPLRTGHVAAWAAQHGTPDWPLPPEAPLRLVTLDAARRQPDTPAAELDLHLITAAIEVGDRRFRVLLAPAANGPVIGPRCWSRPRLAMAAMLPLCALMLGSFASLLGPRADRDAAAPALAAASAASAAASAAVQTLRVAAASAPPASASSSPAQPVVASTSAAASAASAAAPQAAASHAVFAAAEAASRPVSTSPQRGRIELSPLVPRLGPDERQTLRQTAHGLRGPDPREVPAKAYALATRPLADRARSERAAAQLQALALLQRMPMKAELMQTGGAWRAVFWPFRSAEDAEKVRLALADKGLPTEVIEF